MQNLQDAVTPTDLLDFWRLPKMEALYHFFRKYRWGFGCTFGFFVSLFLFLRWALTLPAATPVTGWIVFYIGISIVGLSSWLFLAFYSVLFFKQQDYQEFLIREFFEHSKEAFIRAQFLDPQASYEEVCAKFNAKRQKWSDRFEGGAELINEDRRWLNRWRQATVPGQVLTAETNLDKLLATVKSCFGRATVCGTAFAKVEEEEDAETAAFWAAAGPPNKLVKAFYKDAHALSKLPGSCLSEEIEEFSRLKPVLDAVQNGYFLVPADENSWKYREYLVTFWQIRTSGLVSRVESVATPEGAPESFKLYLKPVEQWEFLAFKSQ